MLDTDSEGETLGLDLPALAVEHFIDIAGRVARGKDNLAGLIYGAVIYRNIKRAVGLLDDVGHTRIKMVFTAMFNDAVADVLDDYRKLVASDMRMRVDKDVRICSETHQLMEDFTDVSPLDERV